MEVNIHEAKTHLSRLLRKVAEGEEVTISRAGVPVAKLVAAPRAQRQRPLGAMEGQIYIADDFDAPLPPDLLASFYGEERKHKTPGHAKAEKQVKKHARR
jgi:prevent-host-death family protein